MTQPTPKYPIGVQSFEKIRTNDLLYVDKTKLVWKLVNEGEMYFLSRPRRFGKSLLLSTLEAYFKGKKDLFEGLAISGLEKDWVEYPVFHIDLNAKEYNTRESLIEILTNTIRILGNEYGVSVDPKLSPEIQFGNLVMTVAQKTQRNVVILVDEYDKPLLNTVDNDELYAEYQRILKSFYGVLKSKDKYIKFGMLTGVGRFGHVSIFSDLNNLRDISLTDTYNGICGITETELDSYFDTSISELAEVEGKTFEDTKDELKKMYDGYHFSGRSLAEGIYNPFSLLNCFASNDFGKYWFETGTPTFLVKSIIKEGCDLSNLNFDVDEDTLMGIDRSFSSTETLLYQTGYLTIKDYDRHLKLYSIGLPNDEVKAGLLKLLFSAYGQENSTEFSISKFLVDLRDCKVNRFIERLQALIARNPYEQAADTEATYHNLLYLLFTLLGYFTDSENHMSHGRSDLVVKTRNHIYIFEFKLNESAEAAMRQINDRHYDSPYKADGRKIVKIGVNFSSEERNINEWAVEETD